jgi:hypothetical protein
MAVANDNGRNVAQQITDKSPVQRVAGEAHG